ncbi:MAG: hypothetical protein RIC80_03020 [Cyclobacteriaceae bacterium]
MNNRSVYKIGFFVMLAINLTVIAFVFTSSSRPPRAPGMSHQKDIKEEISSILKLSAEQKEQYYKSAMEHREKLRLIERSLKERAEQYLGFLRLDDPQEAEMNSVLSELSELEIAKIEATYEHFEQLRDICTAPQLADFDQVMDQVITVLLNDRKNNPPPPRGR